MNSVKKIVEQNLCIGCGICKAVCPKACIRYVRQAGIDMPVVDDTCIHCGKCLQVCSGESFDYNALPAVDFWTGHLDTILNVQAKDQALLRASTSGGAVTQMVQQLLACNAYTSAFLVEGYQCDQTLETKRFTVTDSLAQTPKSRYLTVSHTNAVEYILQHRQEKIILVGTSCFVHSIRKLIDAYSLATENYLLLGLFCDKTMTNRVSDYFKAHRACTGQLERLYFRTKDAGGWPGNVRLCFANGQHVDVSKHERMKVKEYFQPEACLYCLDKLNGYADISFGDNYIASNHDEKGRGSVVIRSAIGAGAWEKCAALFSYQLDTKEGLVRSQHLDTRIENLNFAILKGLSPQVPAEILQQADAKGAEKNYRMRLAKIKIGATARPWQLALWLYYVRGKNFLKKRFHFLFHCA